jgi:hypothetical protein
MKNILAIIMLIGCNAFALVETAQVYVPVGILPNPILAPLGQLVNVETGEVLYVNSIISVLAPNKLKFDCLYGVTYVRDLSIKTRVQLVPPMNEISCGHDFGYAK